MKNIKMKTPDTKIASRIGTKFLDNQDVTVRHIGHGSNNKNFLVKSPGKEIVVKLSLPHKEYEAYQNYIKEKWCIEKSREKGIPGAEVLEVGLFQERAYMIETFCPGINARKLKNKLPVYRKLGKYAKRIHSIKASGFGEKLVSIKKCIFGSSWKKYIDYNIKSLSSNDKLIKMKVLTREQSKEIKGIFKSIKKKKYKFGLNHGDLFAWNVLVEKSGKMNLLDWGMATVHIVPHYDFINIFRRQVERRRPEAGALKAFIKGYRMSEKDFELLKPELLELMLLISFDKLRWAIDKNPGKIKEFTKRAKKMIKLNIFK